MRAASQAFVLCTLLSVVGIFLPSVELRVSGVGGMLLGKRAELSFYTANTKRDVVRAMVASYHRAPGKGYGAAVAGALMPKVGKRTRSYLDDARSAMSTLDEINDEDLGTAATILNVTLWAVLALHLLMAAIVINEMRRPSDRRRRIAFALALSVIVTAVAVGMHLICREAVAAANDEVGARVLRLGVGAYMMPLAALGTLGAAIAMLRRPAAQNPS